MLLVADVKKQLQIPISEENKKLFGIDKLNIKRSSIPAVTHVDYSARIQTVHSDTNPKYYALLKKFKEITGCPVLVNTSFNVRGEPIVCNVQDAFKCFMGTNLDILVCENFILYKNQQNKNLLKIIKINLNWIKFKKYYINRCTIICIFMSDKEFTKKYLEDFSSLILPNNEVIEKIISIKKLLTEVKKIIQRL